MAATSTKSAQRVVSLSDIKFNKDNAVLAALSCIPIVGAVVFFVEKKDLFVRYYAAQYGLLILWFPIAFVLGLIPVIGWIIGLCVLPLAGLGILILVILGALKAYKGERFDIPMLSDWALKLMSMY
ncbi:MAG TPA: DUF4870 domain-containing protein [Candidatus Dojkabacteria bacterium]|nr:DUF4870 domain-containing protein [Candidatus Dojkabacteria bacterium]